MRRLKKVVSAFLALLLLAVCPIYGEEPALAAEIQPRLNMGYRWMGTPKNVYFDLSGLSSSYQTQAVSAMNIWNQVRSLSGEKMVTLNKKTNQYTQSRIIPKGMGKYNALAEATPTLVGQEILAVEICINTSRELTIGANPKSYDVKSIMVHELGHALGIAHCHEGNSSCFSPTCSINVMNPEMPANETRTVLRAYDRSSYQMIYS